jgi:hypothetical protein
MVEELDEESLSSSKHYIYSKAVAFLGKMIQNQLSTLGSSQ